MISRKSHLLQLPCYTPSIQMKCGAYFCRVRSCKLVRGVVLEKVSPALTNYYCRCNLVGSYIAWQRLAPSYNLTYPFSSHSSSPTAIRLHPTEEVCCWLWYCIAFLTFSVGRLCFCIIFDKRPFVPLFNNNEHKELQGSEEYYGHHVIYTDSIHLLRSNRINQTLYCTICIVELLELNIEWWRLKII
jgi:hypothetical protein